MNTAPLQFERRDMRRVLADPAVRRMMVARGTVAVQAREGIDITLEEALTSYDRVMAEKREAARRGVD